MGIMGMSMDKDKKTIAKLNEDLQWAMRKIEQQSNLISQQSTRLSSQARQMDRMRQENLEAREFGQMQEARLQTELQRNRNLMMELEALRQRVCQQENEIREQKLQEQSAIKTQAEGPWRSEIKGVLEDRQQAEQEKAKKKNEFDILVEQQQSRDGLLTERGQNEQGRNEQPPVKDRDTQSQDRQPPVKDRDTQSQDRPPADTEQRRERQRERLRIIEESNESKKQLQQELVECSKSIRDMQRVIKELYQFKPCRQLCELLVNIRQNVFQNIDEIQEDLSYVAEAFGICEFEPGVKDRFDPKCHEQVFSNIQDVRGREIEKVFSPGFEMDGEVIMKAQVSIK